mgnify:CR=1 FL=1
MGSEMCIRDRTSTVFENFATPSIDEIICSYDSLSISNVKFLSEKSVTNLFASSLNLSAFSGSSR